LPSAKQPEKPSILPVLCSPRQTAAVQPFEGHAAACPYMQ
jgi:hypothetical protein